MLNENDNNLDKIKARRNTAFVLIFVLIAIGTIVFHRVEDWSWIDSFYFVVVTSATVGYGDLAPVTEHGRLITAIFILLIVPIILYSFTTIAEIYFHRKYEKRANKKKK